MNVYSMSELLHMPREGGSLPHIQCDSPIEDALYYQIQKAPSFHLVVEPQFEVQTRIGLFRLDFRLTNNESGRCIGIECDGEEFHESERDSRRDAAILLTSEVVSIYRVRGKDCWHHTMDVIEMLHAKERWIMSSRFESINYRNADYTEDLEIKNTPFGYGALVRRYFDYDPDWCCECSGESCQCRPKVKSQTMTDTVIRYLTVPRYSTKPTP